MDLLNDYISTLKFSTNLILATTRQMGSHAQEALPTISLNLHYLKSTFYANEFLEPHWTTMGAILM